MCLRHAEHRPHPIALSPAEREQAAFQRFATVYAEGMARQARDGDRRRAERERRALAFSIERLVDAIAGGTDTPAIRSRLAESEARKAALDGELAALAAPAPALHPNLPELYRRQVDRFRALLAGGEAGRLEATRILREIIERINVHPGERRGETDLELTGRLAAILDLAAGGTGRERGRAGLLLKMVAAEGFEPPTKGL